jgi:hypothetical protein
VLVHASEKARDAQRDYELAKARDPMICCWGRSAKTLMIFGRNISAMALTASQSRKDRHSFKPVLNRLPNSRIAWLRQQKKSVYEVFEIWVGEQLPSAPTLEARVKAGQARLEMAKVTLDKPTQPDQ